MVTKEILTRARDSGVLADAIRAKRLRKLFRTDESVHAWLDDFLLSRHPPDPDCATPDDPCNHRSKPPPLREGTALSAMCVRADEVEK